MSSSPDFNSDEYKSLELAYEFVVPSQDWAIRRLEAVERRIDNLTRFIITITLALGASAIAIAELSSEAVTLLPDHSPYISAASFLFAIVLGMYVRQMGNLSLLDPMGLYRNYIKKSEPEFRGLILFYAGKQFAANEKLIRCKSWGGTGMIILFLFEISSAAVWFHGLTTQ